MSFIPIRVHTIFLISVILACLVGCNNAAALNQTALETLSDQGTFRIEITWTQNDIGRANSFDIRFIEPETQEEIEDVIYDFSIYNDNHRETLRRSQSITHQEFTFGEVGSYVIGIDNIDGLDEGAKVPLQVTPEFPLGALLIIAIAILAVVLISKQNNNDLFRKWTN